MDAMMFVVVDVGCIECGESTSLVGIFHSREDAEKAVTRRAESEDGRYFAGGQHHVLVLEGAPAAATLAT